MESIPKSHLKLLAPCDKLSKIACTELLQLCQKSKSNTGGFFTVTGMESVIKHAPPPAEIVTRKVTSSIARMEGFLDWGFDTNSAGDQL